MQTGIRFQIQFGYNDERSNEDNLTMDKIIIQQKINLITAKREFLVKLSEQPNLGILKLDVIQALSELDDLIEDFSVTFPEFG
jgi:hypothetical protein